VQQAVGVAAVGDDLQAQLVVAVDKKVRDLHLLRVPDDRAGAGAVDRDPIRTSAQGTAQRKNEIPNRTLLPACPTGNLPVYRFGR
jgi:hypothetical protein